MTIPEIPRRLRQRPRTPAGLPIPYLVVTLPDGRPDFRTSDPERWLTVCRRRLCALCGQPLNRSGGWFIGGAKSITLRTFTDPPMHRECAEFALRTCPFLAMPKAHFSDPERRPPPEGHVIVPIVDTARPDRFGLGRAASWRIAILQGVTLIIANPWLELHWWRDGEQIS